MFLQVTLTWLVKVQEKCFFNQFNADACEMEGGAIAQVCCSWHVPFIIVRVLSDLAGSDSHVEFDEFIEDSSIKAAQDSQKSTSYIGCLEMMIREFKDTPFELNHQEDNPRRRIF